MKETRLGLKSYVEILLKLFVLWNATNMETETLQYEMHLLVNFKSVYT